MNGNEAEGAIEGGPHAAAADGGERAGMLRGLVPPLLSLLLLAGCQTAPEWVHPYGAANPLTGTIYDVRRQAFVDEATMLDELADADFVLLGESHDNLDHHRLQARLVGELTRRGKRLAAVAFEMIPTSQQPQLVEHLADSGGQVAGLGDVLAWEQRGWPAFEAYRPIFAEAVGSGAQIVAAGLPVDLEAAVLASGFDALPASFVARTRLTADLPPPLAADLEHEIARRHCGELPAELVRGLMRVQRAKDASFADRLLAATGRGQGVLIAGAEHARRDWGVPRYLALLRPGARIVSLAFVEVDLAAKAPPVSLAYDYVWFTPSAHPPGHDRCSPSGIGPRQLEARRMPRAEDRPAGISLAAQM